MENNAIDKTCVILAGRQTQRVVNSIKKIIEYLNADLFLVYENDICNYSSHKNLKDKIITGYFRPTWRTDHIAIIPRKYKYEFFSARMDLIRTNTEIIIRGTEHIYFLPIEDICEKKVTGRYKILRK